MDELTIYSDGGARGNPGPAASAFVVLKNGIQIFSNYKYLNIATNNVAEYEAAVMVFEWLSQHNEELSNIRINYYLDSNLIVNQLQGNFKVREEKLKPLYYKIKKLEWELKLPVKYMHVNREKNFLADSLVNKCLDENLDEFHMDV